MLAIVAVTTAWLIAPWNGALTASLITAMTALVCGLAVYPIVGRLKKSQTASRTT